MSSDKTTPIDYLEMFGDRMIGEAEDDATRNARRVREAQAHLDNLITVDNPERSIRQAVLERVKELGITDLGMQADLIGNSVMDLEIISRRYLEEDSHADHSFQGNIEKAYYSAQESKWAILQKTPVRGQEPDNRFPKGMIEYYHEKCRNNKFCEEPFVGEDGKLTLTAKQVQDSITADLRMAACRAALKEIGFTDSPILKQTGRAEGR